MTQQTINIGTAPNDGTGDPARTAYTKCNNNFTELYQISRPTGNTIEFQFNNTTTEPPSSGQIRFNQATQSSTTKLWANHTTSSGVNIKQFLSVATTGAKLILQDKIDNTNFIKFDVTGAPIDKTNYWEFDVAVTAFGGTLPNAPILAAVVAAQSNTGTTTNDDAPEGKIGEFIECVGTGAAATVTISNASPAVITDAAHGLNIAQVVHFTTSGALPTGLTLNTNYYVSSQGYAADAYSVSTSVANALAGTSVNTSSAGSGIHTRANMGVLTHVTNLDVGGFSLTAGDWDVDYLVRFTPSATTTINAIQCWVNSVSATLPTTMYISIQGYNSVVVLNSNSLTGLTRRYSLAAPTTIYGSARANFGTAPLYATINMRARRVR